MLSGRRPFIYTYDVVKGVIDKVHRIQNRKEKSWEVFATSPGGEMIALIGKDGYIVLLDGGSYSFLAEFKMSGTARAVTFSYCGNYVLASGSDGQVWKWDVRKLGDKRPVYRYKNQDGSIVQSLACSSTFTAVGSESGVVNIYDNRREERDFSKQWSAEREPIKALMNIKTAVDNLSFNHDGQILLMSSRRSRDCMRLVHMPSATVYRNWPTSKTPLGYAWSTDFSPNSGALAIGNDKGKCLMYRLSYYKDI